MSLYGRCTRCGIRIPDDAGDGISGMKRGNEPPVYRHTSPACCITLLRRALEAALNSDHAEDDDAPEKGREP